MGLLDKKDEQVSVVQPEVPQLPAVNADGTEATENNRAEGKETPEAAGTADAVEETVEEYTEPLHRVNPDPQFGLTEEQVENRRKNGAVNVAVDANEVTLKDIIKENVFTYFNLIFAIIAGFLFAVGSYRDLTFLPIIIGNTLIGIVQEWRAKKLLDKMNIMNAAKCDVVRDGKRSSVPVHELLLDDIVIFTSGNQIPADAIVASGEVQVNESLLTGEADEVAKKEGDTLMSGSFIVSGACRARLDAVGADSYVSKLTMEAKARKTGEQSEMIRSLERLVKTVGVLIVPIAIILFVQQYKYSGAPMRDAVTSTAAAIIGMIPEGLFLLASVAMAVSAMRLAMGKVLVHNMKSIETLARVDVLCVDKTGTITENTMTVKGVVPLRQAGAKEEANVPAAEAAQNNAGEAAQNSAGDVTAEAEKAPVEAETASSADRLAQASAEESAYQEDEDQDPLSPIEEFTPEQQATLELVIGDFAAAQNADNITMQAMKKYFTKQTGRRPEKVWSFSSVYKYSAAQFGNKYYVLGAPEFVLRADYDLYRENIEQYSSIGYRVLVIGQYQGELDGGALVNSVIPEGLVLLMNPVREKAPETFRYFKEQDVTVKVISGDNPMTVSEVAQQAGIEGAENYIDASTLEEKDMKEACEKYTVFGRVNPQQKRQLVAALKSCGHTVAMTGDGVNDVLALKDADCSIAMASGSDAAAHAAQMVLLESDFSKMPAVVTEGRRVVNNIERSASLFLVKNIFSLLMSIFSIVFMVDYPLQPSQVSLISMFTIGAPAFVLSLETNNKRLEGHFLSNVFYRALPAGLTDFAVISALVVFCNEFKVGPTDLATSCTILLAIVGIMILYKVCKPMTKFHWALWFAMIFGILFSMIFLNNIFRISALSRRSAMLLVIFAIITEPLLRYLSLLIRKIWDLCHMVKVKYREHRLTQQI